MRGRVVRTGRAPKSSPTTCRRATAELESREWPDDDTAPGDALVRLRSARVLQDGVVTGPIDIRRPVGIEFTFSVLGSGSPIFPKVKRL